MSPDWLYEFLTHHARVTSLRLRRRGYRGKSIIVAYLPCQERRKGYLIFDKSCCLALVALFAGLGRLHCLKWRSWLTWVTHMIHCSDFDPVKMERKCFMKRTSVIFPPGWGRDACLNPTSVRPLGAPHRMP
jgi:hypothetical protein